MEIKRFVVGFWQTNCYLLISNDEMAIVDPGPGIGNVLKEIKNSKAKLKYIINTHYHLDHTFSNKKIKKETGAEILIHEAEKNFTKFSSFKADRFLRDGEKIKIGNETLKIIHTPGHTRGSICLLGKNFILTGDTLFKEATPVTHFPGGSKKDLENSFEKLEKILKPGMIVYPGHEEIFECTETFFGLIRY
jgi:glyoxylase-like metal-dependent hydrolase (beta-lactamase superfamily II)